MIEKKVAYEELNLLPIWLNKKSPKKIPHALYNVGLYFFKELNISISYQIKPSHHKRDRAL